MGSRISINLNELVGNPRVKISIESEQHKVLPGDTTYINSTAQVTFLHDAASTNVYTFDLVSGTDKYGASLERDFNYFRHSWPNEPLMRCLFECCVSFQVFVG